MRYVEGITPDEINAISRPDEEIRKLYPEDELRRDPYGLWGIEKSK